MTRDTCTLLFHTERHGEAFVDSFVNRGNTRARANVSRSLTTREDARASARGGRCSRRRRRARPRGALHQPSRMIVELALAAALPMARLAFAADCGRIGVSDPPNPRALVFASGESGSRTLNVSSAEARGSCSPFPSPRRASSARRSARSASFSAFAADARSRASRSAASSAADGAAPHAPLEARAFALARPSSTRLHRCAKSSVDCRLGQRPRVPRRGAPAEPLPRRRPPRGCRRGAR